MQERRVAKVSVRFYTVERLSASHPPQGSSKIHIWQRRTWWKMTTMDVAELGMPSRETDPQPKPKAK